MSPLVRPLKLRSPLPPMFAGCRFTDQAHLRPAQAEGGRDQGEAQGRKAGCRRVDDGVAFILSRQTPQQQQQYLDTLEQFVVCTFSGFCGLGRVCFFFHVGCDTSFVAGGDRKMSALPFSYTACFKCRLDVLVFWALVAVCVGLLVSSVWSCGGTTQMRQL